ncbi:hypothetical protein ACFQZC_15260 [Streptacidiphilus monticola]
MPLRLALLAALAALPSGTGITAGRRDAEEWLAQAAVWHRPALREDEDLDARLAATLAESRLLGVVAHGVLTPVGHAVLALLEAGAARYFPAVPGTGPSSTDTRAWRRPSPRWRTRWPRCCPRPRAPPASRRT